MAIRTRVIRCRFCGITGSLPVVIPGALMALADRSARPFRGHAGQVLPLAFAPDGATIATGGVDRTVRIWDTRTGAELRQLTGHTGEVHAVAFSPDGAIIASGSSDHTGRGRYAP